MSNSGNNDKSNNSHDEYQKKKKRKELTRKIIINIFVWLVIVTFVIALGMNNYGNDGRNVDLKNVAAVNGKVYTYQPGSLFYDLLGLTRDSMGKKIDSKTDPANIDAMAIANSVDFLTNYAITHDFSKNLGIAPSPEVLKNIVESILKTRLSAIPSQGLLDIAEFEYANYSILGDFNNVVAVIPPTSGELMSFLDLANFNVIADVIYLNVSNYIIGKIKDADVVKFYEENYSKYITELTVEEISVSNKALAYEILRTAVSSGDSFEKTAANIKGKASWKDSLVLKKTSGLQKRFDMALPFRKGQIVTNVQFENKEYHIMRVKDHPSLSSATGVNRDMVKSDYVGMNFETLRKQYDQELKTLLDRIQSMARAGKDFSSIASETGFTYSRTGKLTPVSDHLKNVKGDNLPLDYIHNPEWMDFLYTAKKNEVSKTFTDDSQVVVLKVVDNGVNKKISVQDINKDVVEQYLRFKNVAAYLDWSKNLKSRYTVKVYNDTLASLTEKNER